MKTLSMAVGAIALAGVGTLAMARQEGPSSCGGRSVGAASTCPVTEWHILPVAATGAAKIAGVAYFSDMSGISRIDGMRAADGSISGRLVPVWQRGPAGNFTGIRTADRTHVELHGVGCAKHTVDLMRMPYAAASPGGNG